MVVKASDLCLQLCQLSFDVTQIYVVNRASVKPINRECRGGRRGHLWTFEPQLVAKGEQFEMKFLKFSFQALCFGLSPKRFFDPAKYGGIVFFMTAVIWFSLNPRSDQAEFLM